MRLQHRYGGETDDHDRDGRVIARTEADWERESDDPNGWLVPSPWFDPDARDYD